MSCSGRPLTPSRMRKPSAASSRCGAGNGSGVRGLACGTWVIAAEPPASTKRYFGSVIARRRVDNKRSRFCATTFHGFAPSGFNGSPWAVWAGVAPAPARPSIARTYEVGSGPIRRGQCRTGEELRNDGGAADRTRASALGARTPFAHKGPNAPVTAIPAPGECRSRPGTVGPLLLANRKTRCVVRSPGSAGTADSRAWSISRT
jgi:hypothetical protein